MKLENAHSPYVGCFGIETPTDLHQKLEEDLKKLTFSQSPTDAFNFFVAADSLPEWLNCKKMRNENPYVRIVCHLANAAKHLTVNQHHSVMATEKQRYCEEGYVEPGYFHDPLIVHLAQKEQQELGIASIEAVALGTAALQFWKSRL